MSQNLLSKRVLQDIADFLQLHNAYQEGGWKQTETKNFHESGKLVKTETLFYDKRDFQIQLYAYLDKLRQIGFYDRIYADYILKRNSVLDNDELIYPWDDDPKFDLVVRKGERFVPVQLTYDPADLHVETTRFASRHNTVVLPRVYSASSDFWKSVHQIDMIRYSMITTLNPAGSLLSSRLESSVESGIALFLSNNYRYWDPDRNQAFIYSDRAIDTRYTPPADAYMLKNIPKDIPLRDSYTLKWNKIILADETQGHPFQYTLLEIPQPKNANQN